MSRNQTLDAVVLRTVDIGEADRFCILFTRERGRLAARARAVRKTTSRMGGSLLPMRRVFVDIYDQDTSLLITGVADQGQHTAGFATFLSFLEHSRGIDLLLSLTEDDEPLPMIFDLLCGFLACPPDDMPELLTAFQARLLHLLGILPATAADARVRVLSESAQGFLHAAASPLPFEVLAEFAPRDTQLSAFLDEIIDEHAVRQMKSKDVVIV